MIYQYRGKWRIIDETENDAGMSFDTREEAERGLLAYGRYLDSGEITDALGVYDPLVEDDIVEDDK